MASQLEPVNDLHKDAKQAMNVYFECSEATHSNYNTIYAGYDMMQNGRVKAETKDVSTQTINGK
jgi:hypothetical protein